jgi:hypothetical protein
MSTEGPSLSPDGVSYPRRTGTPPGFRPLHLVIGIGIAVVWFGVLGFVLTHGRGDASSVDVYSQLPPGLNAALAAKGVSYQGLSPVSSGVQQQALAHLPAVGEDNGGQPLVFRTSFTVAAGSGKPGTATSALMVVVPDPQGTEVHVDFVDPTSFRTLESIRYAATPTTEPGK